MELNTAPNLASSINSAPNAVQAAPFSQSPAHLAPRETPQPTSAPQILCIAAFYKQKPTMDAPYRQLILEQDDSCTGWQVRLLGGAKWGHENQQVFAQFAVAQFSEGEEIYGQKFTELHDAGWKAYSPYISW
jgi:hypothetical protein